MQAVPGNIVPLRQVKEAMQSQEILSQSARREPAALCSLQHVTSRYDRCCNQVADVDCDRFSPPLLPPLSCTNICYSEELSLSVLLGFGSSFLLTASVKNTLNVQRSSWNKHLRGSCSRRCKVKAHGVSEHVLFGINWVWQLNKRALHKLQTWMTLCKGTIDLPGDGGNAAAMNSFSNS